jgi:competence protein ComEA
MTEDGKVILNLASAEDLRHLPGVGPKRADAILALRVRLGRFKQVSDLLRVKGIGVRGLKKLTPHVVLDAPRPSA